MKNNNFATEIVTMVMVVVLMFGSLLAVWFIEQDTPKETAVTQSVNQHIDETYDFCEEILDTYEDELEPEEIAIVRAMIKEGRG